MAFTHRQRLQAILDHKEADRVPIDFGAGGQTGMMASLVYQIKKDFGLLDPDERIKIVEPYQMLGEVDRKMQEYFAARVKYPAPFVLGNCLAYPITECSRLCSGRCRYSQHSDRRWSYPLDRRVRT